MQKDDLKIIFNILVADDERGVRMIVEKCVKNTINAIKDTYKELFVTNLQIPSYDIKCIVVSNKNDVLKTLTENSIILVTDNDMENKNDGLYLTETIKKNEKTQKMHVVMISATSDPKLESEFTTRGGNAFFGKPFKTIELSEHLYKAIEEILSQKSLIIKSQDVPTLESSKDYEQKKGLKLNTL